MNKDLEESLEPFESHPIIQNQFEYVEVSVIRKDTSFRVVYTYVKPDHSDKSIRASCLIHTGIVGNSIEECAIIVNKVMALGLLGIPVIAKGSVYTEDMKIIDEVDWNEKLKHAIEFMDQEEQEVVYH